jgi:dihydroorotate dehydrogenase (NAD+) catalytic subunit
MNARDAIELLLAGADAVQVGTATFADPKAPWKVLSSIDRWCRRHDVASVRELVGGGHGQLR